MNDTATKITERFIENYNIAKRVFKLDGNYAAVSYAASLLTGDSRITEERLKEAKKLIGKYGTGFVTVKNTLAKEVVAAAVAESVDPEYAAEKINEIYSSLKKITPGADFYGVPAAVIFKNAGSAEYESTVEKVKVIYKGLKKNHPFLTSYEDVVSCTLMALSQKSVEDAVEDCEDCYRILKDKYFFNNNAQTVACVLSVFPDTPAEKCKKATSVEKALKEAKVVLGDRALAAIAAASMIVKTEDLQSYINDINEISETLKSVRGLGNMGVGRTFRNLISSSIAAVSYTEQASVNIEGVTAGSVVSAMFAQQLTMVVCMASAISMGTVVANSSGD
ncbi:MAG: DUF4003 family protein [Lachnospiraceae bacterium]|nr:DUF4003 family protein [Lachnospiraceae bacterium]